MDILYEFFGALVFLVVLAIWVWILDAGNKKIDSKIEDSYELTEFTKINVFYNKYAHGIWWTFMISILVIAYIILQNAF